jgi:hypothetical protein
VDAGAGPVLLAGLFLLAAADALGETARTVVLIGVDRSLHGAGAGIALVGVVAVITERRAHQRQRHAHQPASGINPASGTSLASGTGSFPPRRVGLRPAGGPWS